MKRAVFFLFLYLLEVFVGLVICLPDLLQLVGGRSTLFAMVPYWSFLVLALILKLFIVFKWPAKPSLKESFKLMGRWFRVLLWTQFLLDLLFVGLSLNWLMGFLKG